MFMYKFNLKLPNKVPKMNVFIARLELEAFEEQIL